MYEITLMVPCLLSRCYDTPHLARLLIVYWSKKKETEGNWWSERDILGSPSFVVSVPKFEFIRRLWEKEKRFPAPSISIKTSPVEKFPFFAFLQPISFSLCRIRKRERERAPQVTWNPLSLSLSLSLSFSLFSLGAIPPPPPSLVHYVSVSRRQIRGKEEENSLPGLVR